MIAFPERLIIFARYPEIGKVKTRLIPDLSAEAATVIYQELAEYTLNQARSLRLIRNIAIEVWFTGGTEDQMKAWLGDDLDYQIQVGETLGDRLIYALQSTIQRGSKSILIIGTDCPELDAQILNQGFSQLQNHDLVLGAATDGGYYLIGLQKFIPELFMHIPWSTSEVLAKTLNIAQALGMSQFILPTLTDVDTAQDLEVWEKAKAQILVSNQKISIIIPTLNEAVNIERSLASIAKAENNAKNIEVIVVDGGSADRTVAIAKSMGAKVISGTLGKANQMNLGASLATGEILVFLHADTVLPTGFEQAIRKILINPKTIAGAFKLKIDGSGWGLRLVEWGVNRRSQIFQMPYGDQAIFIKFPIFQSLGGFAQLPIMEDFDLILRLKKIGQIAIAPLSVTTSDRRWQKLGIFRTTLINQVTIIGYFFGIKPIKLASWYHHRKK